MRVLVPLLLLAACSGPSGTVENTAENTGDTLTSAGAVEPPSRDLAGRWTGVEGMVLQVTPTAPGRYRLAMQSDLDTQGTYQGRADGNGIAFERGSRTLRLRPTDGEATGLKWLAGKSDCLTVAEGEGYCRD